MVRLFIAIELPENIREAFVEAQKVLAVSGARLTYVKPEAMHITLKFIGEIAPSLVEQVKATLSTLSFEPFEMRPGAVSINNPKNPRVIWVGCYDNGKSSLLHGIIEEKLSVLGLGKDKRNYKPHATIARVRRNHASLKKQVDQLAKRDFGSYEVRSFTLKKSTLTPEGPIYEELLEVGS